MAVIKLLLKAGGGQADWTDEIGGTPVSYAIHNTHKAVIALLLKEGIVRKL